MEILLLKDLAVLYGNHALFNQLLEKDFAISFLRNTILVLICKVGGDQTPASRGSDSFSVPRNCVQFKGIRCWPPVDECPGNTGCLLPSCTPARAEAIGHFPSVNAGNTMIAALIAQCLMVHHG